METKQKTRLSSHMYNGHILEDAKLSIGFDSKSPGRQDSCAKISGNADAYLYCCASEASMHLTLLL